MDSITRETSFVGRSGLTVVIERHGQDDYSAWFTDNPNDDTSGYSVRGTLLDILEEVREEVPARKVTPDTERLETIAQFIDIFDDFLDYKGVDIPNDERDEDSYAANIYGTDYGWISDRIELLLRRLGVLN